jgi:hypothetical protein
MPLLNLPNYKDNLSSEISISKSDEIPEIREYRDRD